MRTKYGKEDRVNNIAIKLMGEGFKKSDIKMILEADEEFIKEILLRGNNLEINGVGVLKVKTANARAERQGINPATQERITIGATPTHSKIGFKVSKPLADELKAKTLNNPF